MIQLEEQHQDTIREELKQLEDENYELKEEMENKQRYNLRNLELLQEDNNDLQERMNKQK